MSHVTFASYEWAPQSQCTLTVNTNCDCGDHQKCKTAHDNHEPCCRTWKQHFNCILMIYGLRQNKIKSGYACWVKNHHNAAPCSTVSRYEPDLHICVNPLLQDFVQFRLKSIYQLVYGRLSVDGLILHRSWNTKRYNELIHSHGWSCPAYAMWVSEMVTRDTDMHIWKLGRSSGTMQYLFDLLTELLLGDLRRRHPIYLH